MLTREEIGAAADLLYEAEKAREQIPALTLTYDMDMDDAYAVQKRWVDRKIREGARILGYKIGLTSKAMQTALNIDVPDYGVLLDDMEYANGGYIPARDFTDPRIEVELAFVLGKPLFGEEVGVEQVLEATDYVTPALELIAARSLRTDPETGYTRTVFDTIADNAGSAGVVVSGNRFAPGEIDLRWSGALLYLNGTIEETGLAAGVLGHPANGISWICKRFAPHGIGLEPGQLLLSGSFTRPVTVAPGDRVRADYGPLGAIEVNFA